MSRIRAEKLLDTQKRRLYRRAHGMEDLNAEELQGVDVRGLVDWDDGLTNPQREALRQQQAITNGEAGANQGENTERSQPEKRKIKKWLGIW